MPPQTQSLPAGLLADLRKHFRRAARTQATAAEFEYRAEAQVDLVYDGDTWFGRHRPDPTFTVAMDTRHRRDDFERNGQYYRLSGIDTHELNASDDRAQAMATEEKQWAAQWVQTGQAEYDGEWPFVIDYATTPSEGDYEDAFGRPLCQLARKCDGERLATSLSAAFPDRDLVYDPAGVAETHRAGESPRGGVPWAPTVDHLPR